MFVCFFFFFKQKTAYEMRISDWSSDVCSSDLSFLLMKLAPGGPFDGERVLDPVTEAALARRYGLDQPLGAQFLGYVGGLARGDFGPSMVYRDFTVTELIARGLPVSLMLGAAIGRASGRESVGQ